MAGHLFIVHGSLLHLDCDAWLLPSDEQVSVAPRWFEQRFHQDDWWRWPEPGWTRGRRVLELTGDPPPDAPRTWLGAVGASSTTPASWFVAAATEFVARAATKLKGDGARPRRGRPKHLLGLPVVGTGYGGGYRRAAEIVEVLLPELYRVAAEHDVDLALTAIDAPVHAAAQEARRRHWRSGDGWRALAGRMSVDEARSLARRAERGRLVLFLGAGIGRGAGLPLWRDLLQRLARDAGIADLDGLAELDYLDQAQLLERRLGGGAALGKAVERELGKVHRHSLAHALLAAMPVAEVVTTNYDVLYELACMPVLAPERLTVLGAGDPGAGPRWLLKMHGCVTRPDSIVLTRTDYLRYHEERAALAGIVQALLLTKHMLFVGFSLDDPNFHRIADTVRRAVRGDATRALADGGGDGAAFGTVLSIGRRSFAEELWSPDLRWVDAGSADGPDELAATARAHDVFLDCIAGHARHADHVLDPRFDELLEGDDAELAAALRQLLERFTELHGIPPLRHAESRSAAWSVVQRMLVDLGAGRRVPGSRRRRSS